MPVARLLLLLLAVLPCLFHLPCLQPASAQVSITVIPDASSYYALSDAAAAYELLSPDVSITVQQPSVTEEDALSLLLNRSVALITTTTVIASRSPAAADVLQSPLLLSAIVPVYNFGAGFTSTAIELVLSPALLADIFLGNITHWNDSRLTALNPMLSAPSIPIVLVLQREPASTLSLSFTQCMTEMSPAFASAIGITASPIYPVSSYAAAPVYATGIAGVAAAVAYTAGGLGITFLPTATAMGNSVAAMVNSAQQAVTASPTTTFFSLIEMITQQTSSTVATYPTSWDLLPLSLANAQGQQSWPMVALVLADVHVAGVSNAPLVCEERAAALSFLLFLYNSALAATLLTARQHAQLPAEVVSQIGTLELLTTAYLCNTTTPAQTVAADLGYLSATNGYTEYTLTGDGRYASLLQQLTYLYSDQQQARGIPIDFSYVARDTSQYAFSAVLSGAADLAVLSMEQLLPSQVQQVNALRDSEQYFFLPFFVSAQVPIYNPQLSATISVASTLNIPITTVLAMSSFGIVDWLSPALVPILGLGNATANVSSLPIMNVGSCDPSDPGWSVRDWLYLFTPWAPALLSALPDTSALYYQPCNSTALLSIPNLIEAEIPSEASVPAVLNAVYGGFSHNTAAASYSTGVIYVDFGNGPMTASVDSMLGCMDSFDPLTLTATVNASTNASCYPLSRTLYVMVPRSYQDTQQDGCGDAQALLRLLQWIISNTQLDAAMEQVLLLRTARIPAIQTALTAALNSITCVDPLTGDSNVILVTVPVIWSMSRAVTITGVVLGSLGVLCSLSALATTAAFHRHSAMRAGSPIFLSLTLLGLSVFFLAPIFLSLPPSSLSCSGLAWTANLGFMLCFAPLFAKTYRVYRIYGGSKLTVVKLSNQRLLLMTAALLTLELVLLLTWQLLDPMQPLTIVQTEGARQYQYGQCSVQDNGLLLFILLCAEKGVMLVFGALMAFSTRRVSAQYSEAGGIAWSIYNVVLSVAVLTPIVLLTQAMGNTEALLIDFLLLWIGSFTLCVLFIPRLSVLVSRQAETQQLNALDAGERVSSGAFSFLSLASFDSGHAMAQYLAALETHLLKAKNRYGVTKMKSDAGGSKVGDSTHNRHRSTVESGVLRDGGSQQLKARPRGSTTAQPLKPSLSYMTQTGPTWATPTAHAAAAAGQQAAAGSSSSASCSDDADRPNSSKFASSARTTKTPLLPRSSNTLSVSPSPSSKVAPHPQHVPSSAAAESASAEDSQQTVSVAGTASVAEGGAAAGAALLAGVKRRSSESLSSRSAKVTPLPQPPMVRTTSTSSNNVSATVSTFSINTPRDVSAAAIATAPAVAAESAAAAEVTASEQKPAAPTAVAALLAGSLSEPELPTASDLRVDDLSSRQAQSDDAKDRDDEGAEERKEDNAPPVRAATKKIQLVEVTQQPTEAADAEHAAEQVEKEEEKQERESSVLKTERLGKPNSPGDAEGEQQQQQQQQQ